MSDAEFDRYANDYDRLLEDQVDFFDKTTAYFAEYKVKRLTRLASPTVRRVLDYGCGTGRSIPYLTRHFPNAEIFGTDPSPDSLDVARAHSPDATFFELNALSDHPGHFDLVLAANVFHHIPPAQRETAVANIAAALAPGGGVAIFEHNPRNPLTRKIVRDCPMDADAVLLERRETTRLLSLHGLRPRSRGYTVFFPGALAALRPLERYLEWLPLGGQYFVFAIRPNAS